MNKFYRNFPLVLILFFSLLILFNCRLHRHTQDVFTTHNSFVEAHRGVNREIFQNTKEAFTRAIQYDIDSFETDVWMTKDEKLVLIHGGSAGDLSGYYDHPGKVPDLTWDELSTYRTIEDGLKMPLLSETLELTKDKIFMNLEIKDPRVDIVFDKIVELIKEYDYFDQIALSSFHHGYYSKVEEYNNNHEKKLVFGFLYSKGQSSKFDYNKPGHTLNIYWTDATKEVCDKAHENGMAIQAWFNMGEDEPTSKYKTLIENGADIICDNVAILAKKFRDNYYSLKNIK